MSAAEESAAAEAVGASGLWKVYGDKPGVKDSGYAALRGVELSIREGEVVALVGKSGSGKTTLLNLIAGLDSATRGTVSVWGSPLSSMSEAARVEYRRRELGFVFQFFNLLPTLTALENVMLAEQLVGRTNTAQAVDALGAVGLADKGKRYPSELSGGEQQRVAIARAVVKKPRLILADEPTGNLDSHTGLEVMELLAGRTRELGATLIYSTHAGSVAELAERSIRITDGQLADTPDEPGD